MGQMLNCKLVRKNDCERHVGTVVNYSEKGRNNQAHNTVLVQWDCGRRTDYKIEHNESYDLLVLDSAGVHHGNKRCSVCKGSGPLKGTRWHCTVCDDFDLCSACYMSDKHNTLHPFRRFDSQGCTGTLVTPRATSSSVQSQGLFVGARVSRGHNWEWAEQDVGKYGTVVSISGCTQESSRNIASVRWADGSQNLYRIGHGGKVDLKCARAAPGSKYYKDHLAPCAKLVKIRQSARHATEHIIQQCKFKVGDRVKVVLEVEVLRSLLEGHGGWNSKMEQLIGKEGVVSRITTAGDVRFQYDPLQCSNISCKWTFHPAALIRLDQDSPSSSPNLQTSRSRSNSQHSKSEARNLASETILLESVMSPTGENRRSFIKHITSNNLEGACAILTSHQTDFINECHNGRIALHIAAYHGYDDSVKFLLSQSANINLKDSTGKCALHHLFTGYRLYLEGEMLSLGPIDRSNYLQCVKTLVQNNCDVNCKDIEGNSPLHHAVACDRSGLNLFLESQNINLKITNNKSWNSFHQAAYLGNVGSMEMLIDRCPSLLNFNTASKNSALHIATSNNKRQAVQYLLKQGIEANAEDEKGITSLHIACSTYNIPIIQDLVNQEAIDLDVENNQSQTCVDVVLESRLFGKHKLVNLPEHNSWTKVKLILLKRKLMDIDEKCDQALAVLSYLAFHGESFSHFAGVKPREWKDCITSCSQSFTSKSETAVRNNGQCQICDENADLISFQPCGHSAVCKACCVEKMRKCLVCKSEITTRILNGRLLSAEVVGTQETIVEMQKKICDLEDKMSCQICMERPNNVALTPCGHQLCSQCSKKCRNCPFCRKHVQHIQNLFY